MSWVTSIWYATLIIVSVSLMFVTGVALRKVTKEAIEARKKAEKELREIKRVIKAFRIEEL